MSNIKVYTFELEKRVNLELPEAVKDAMKKTGWNAFGIYELVSDLIKQEKKQNKVNP